jgi:hypothetical protein
VGLVVAAYWLWARPSQLAWGAWPEELARPMPGDELDTTPTFLSTRAISIDGTPEQIWPWLLQMGYSRAGFYGYDILENVGSPRGLASADQIVPELQHFKVGDEVPISAAASAVFYAIEPNQYLIWAGATGPKPGGFTWALYPAEAGQTRLVVRIRWTHHSPAQPVLFGLDLFTEFADHLAVRKVLQGVKDRVEGHPEPAALTNLEFAVYVAAALIFALATLLLVACPLTPGRWFTVLASGAGWLITWYAPLPLWAAVLIEAALLGGLWRAFIVAAPRAASRPVPAAVVREDHPASPVF